MSGLGSVDSVYLALAFFVPGFVLSAVRGQFITGRERQDPNLIRCLTYSAINYAVFSWLVYILVMEHSVPWFRVVGWTVVVLVGPVVLGFISGVTVRYDCIRRALQWVGLNPVHPVPTAWDWKFGRMPGEWVLVTLKDGTRFAGYCGSGSFASSDPNERDLYIEQIFDIGDDDTWARRQNGALIAADAIQTVEFWPAPEESKGENDDKLEQ